MSITTLFAPAGTEAAGPPLDGRQPPPLNDEGSSTNRPPAADHRPPSSNSTGPKTPEGKARSSQNARKHGLSAIHLIVREDEREEFAELESSLLADVRPETALETETFRHLLHAAWNLRRLERLEAELFDSGIDPLSDPDLAPTLDRRSWLW